MVDDLSTGEAFLDAFHRRHPSATPRALGGGSLADGRSSYHHLASVIPARSRAPRVLDLACGDGHLATVIAERVEHLDYIGVDLCEDDLAIARQRLGESADLRLERAQALSLESASVDVVLCHMALMLMAPLDPVLVEVARVLAPGGVFAAVVGGGRPTDDDVFTIFAGLCRELDSSDTSFRLGDRRTHSANGLHQLFASHPTFESLEIEEAVLDLSADLETVTRRLALSYNPANLSTDDLAEVSERFRSAVAGRAENGKLPFFINLQCFSVRRKAASGSR